MTESVARLHQESNKSLIPSTLAGAGHHWFLISLFIITSGSLLIAGNRIDISQTCRLLPALGALPFVALGMRRGYRRAAMLRSRSRTDLAFAILNGARRAEPCPVPELSARWEERRAQAAEQLIEFIGQEAGDNGHRAHGRLERLKKGEIVTRWPEYQRRWEEQLMLRHPDAARIHLGMEPVAQQERAAPPVDDGLIRLGDQMSFSSLGWDLSGAADERIEEASYNLIHQVLLRLRVSTGNAIPAFWQQLAREDGADRLAQWISEDADREEVRRILLLGHPTGVDSPEQALLARREAVLERLGGHIGMRASFPRLPRENRKAAGLITQQQLKWGVFVLDGLDRHLPFVSHEEVAAASGSVTGELSEADIRAFLPKESPMGTSRDPAVIALVYYLLTRNTAPFLGSDGESLEDRLEGEWDQEEIRALLPQAETFLRGE